MVRRRKYVHSREKLFRDELPADGQKIAYRGLAQKSYHTGYWDSDARVVVASQGVVSLDGKFGSVLLHGWYGVKNGV